MNRRAFVAQLGALSVVPLLTYAQQASRVRRVGVLMGLPAADPVVQPEVVAFQQGLAELGWRNGENLRIEYRWSTAGTGVSIGHIRELVEQQSEVIVSRSTPTTLALLREVKTIPIVFVQVSDPVGDGIVDNLARPGGNATGFTNIESSLTGKWLELLKELSPGTTHVTLLYSAKTSPGGGDYFLRPLESAAATLKVRAIAAPADQDVDIEKAIASTARERGGALIVSPGVFLVSRRDLVVGLAAKYRVPAVYPFTFWANLGGLMSYGIDSPDVFRRAASYVDRILKGARPADLPVQAPVKFELVVNLNTAKLAGLKVPRSLLARADRIID